MLPLRCRLRCVHFLGSSVFVLGVVTVFPGTTPDAAAAPALGSRPNILLVIADDQSWLAPGALGTAQPRTPAFDQLARDGAAFTHAFAAAPSCTPSRSAVLTGRNIWQIGEAGLLYGTLPQEYPLFTHALQDAGYTVGWTGKGWGPGEWEPGGMKRPPLGREYNRRLHSPPVSAALDSRDYAANFGDFLRERPTDAPFFFWAGITEPHRVYEKDSGVRAGKRPDGVKVPPYWPDTDEVRRDLLDYALEVEWLDTQLARVLAQLESSGLRDSTLVIVTSDNGMPFPRAKVNLYDPGVRMPLAVRWPGQVKPGQTLDAFVGLIDLAPTFLEAARVVVPAGITGRSLLPLLRGEGVTGRDHVYTALERHTWCRPDGATYPIRALRTREFLYLRNFMPERWPTGGPEFISSNKTVHGDVDGCPTKDFMEAPANQARFPREFALNFGRRPREELYDLRRDPHQINNLAADPAFAATREKLWAQLRAHLEQTGDPRIAGRDPWQAMPYRQTVGFGATFNRTLSAAERDTAAGRGAHKPQ
jgi:N-sulfoglucosamine sulfohydrolase